jgi:hypothetical protein
MEAPLTEATGDVTKGNGGCVPILSGLAAL